MKQNIGEQIFKILPNRVSLRAAKGGVAISWYNLLYLGKLAIEVTAYYEIATPVRALARNGTEVRCILHCNIKIIPRCEISHTWGIFILLSTFRRPGLQRLP